MNFYSNYLDEVYGKKTIEGDYFILIWSMSGDVFYIEDFYIKPEFRNKGLGTSIIDSVIKIAKNNECNKLLCSITLSSKYRDKTMMKCLKYGFSINSLGHNIIYLIKDI